MCQRLLAEAQQRAGHLAQVRLASASLSDAIEALPRGSDPKTFQQLMACLCARKALDYISWTDAVGLRAHLDACVRSLKHSSACRSHGPIAQLLSEREKAETVVSAVQVAKQRALRQTLAEAIADGFGSSRNGLQNGGSAPLISTGASQNGDARHGLVFVAHSRLLPSVSSACRAVLADVEVAGDGGGHAAGAEATSRGTHSLGVQLVTVDAQMEAQHVLNLLKRARQLAGGGGGGGTLLFLMSHEKLDTFERFPWSAFRLYVEFDSPPTPLHFAAQLQQPAIAVYLLQPQPAKDGETAEERAAHPDPMARSDFEESLSEPLQELAASVATRGAAATADGEEGGALSAFDESVRLLRAAQGVRYDDAINLGALQREARPEMERPPARNPIRTDAHGMQAISWPLMVGEGLLDAPRLYSLLRGKGVKLIETSAQLPHVILGPSAGLLACDESALADPTAMVTAVRMCEQLSLQDLWLVVMVDDGSGEQQESGSRHAAQEGTSAGARGASTEAILWKQVGEVLARTSGISVRLCVRVSPWRRAWRTLQRILIAHRPSPSEWPCNPGALDEETEHERLLLECGLSPWAARKVVREYTLRSVLSLPPSVRASRFSWLPERVLKRLAALDDDVVKDAGGRTGAMGAGAATNARGEKGRGGAVGNMHTGRMDESGVCEHRYAQQAPAWSMARDGAEAAARAQRHEEEQHRRHLGYTEDTASAWQASHPCWNAEVPPITEGAQRARHPAPASHGQSSRAQSMQWGAEHDGHMQARVHYPQAGSAGQNVFPSSQRKRRAPEVQHQEQRRVYRR